MLQDNICERKYTNRYFLPKEIGIWIACELNVDAHCGISVRQKIHKVVCYERRWYNSSEKVSPNVHIGHYDKTQEVQ